MVASSGRRQRAVVIVIDDEKLVFMTIDDELLAIVLYNNIVGLLLARLDELGRRRRWVCGRVLPMELMNNAMDGRMEAR